MNRIYASALELLGAAAVLLCSPVLAQDYSVTDLGVELPGNSYALGINNHGQVVGYWLSPTGARGFLYAPPRFLDLGHLGSTNDYALSINNRGEVVGFAEGPDGVRSFLHKGGKTTSLGVLDGANIFAHGINDLGHIVGYTETSRGAEAFLYLDAGQAITLGTLGGTSSYAFGINARDQIVGSSLSANDAVMEAFLWEQGMLRSLNSQLPVGSAWLLHHARAINLAGNTPTTTPDDRPP